MDFSNYIQCDFSVNVITKSYQIYMAKRQKNLRAMFYCKSQSNDIHVPIVGSTLSDCTN